MKFEKLVTIVWELEGCFMDLRVQVYIFLSVLIQLWVWTSWDWDCSLDLVGSCRTYFIIIFYISHKLQRPYSRAYFLELVILWIKSCNLVSDLALLFLVVVFMLCGYLVGARTYPLEILLPWTTLGGIRVKVIRKCVDILPKLW